VEWRRRERERNTHCGNKYQKSLVTFSYFFSSPLSFVSFRCAGFEFRISKLLFFSQNIQQMDVYNLSDVKVKQHLLNICSSSSESFSFSLSLSRSSLEQLLRSRQIIKTCIDHLLHILNHSSINFSFPLLACLPASFCLPVPPALCKMMLQ
jgi:hypothetical protein